MRPITTGIRPQQILSLIAYRRIILKAFFCIMSAICVLGDSGEEQVVQSSKHKNIYIYIYVIYVYI